MAAPLWPQQGTITLHFRTVEEEVVAERLHRLHSKNADREAELKKMFGEAGCPAEQLQEEVARRKDPPNILCTLPGSAPSLIIVGAHFDHAELGYGAVDDWSGASLLPSLYEGLKVAPRRHTFVFVGFTDEEKGLAGSTTYVRQFPRDQLSSIHAVVNLECLGVGPSEVWAHAADKRLLDNLAKIAYAMHINLTGMNVEQVGEDDTLPFRDKKIPTITLHSITQQSWRLLHSPDDNLRAVHLNELYESYRLVSEYLAFIDQDLN